LDENNNLCNQFTDEIKFDITIYLKTGI